MLSAQPGQRACPNCRIPLHNAELGIPVPLVPLHVNADMQGNLNVATNQVFVHVENQFSVLGEQKERVLFPLFLEAIKVPVMTNLVQVRSGVSHPFEGVEFIRQNLYYGRTPQHQATGMTWKKVGLIPGLTAELNMFWLYRDRTYDNFCLSVLRCRELMRKVSGSAAFLEYNMQYAPIAALYRSQGAMEVAVLAQPNVVKPRFSDWQDWLLLLLGLFSLCLLVNGFLRWDDIVKYFVGDHVSLHDAILFEDIDEIDAYME